MKLIPVLTEKSLNEAKRGKYTFLVESGLTKPKIKKLIESVYEVNVSKIRTINKKSLQRKNLRGRVITEKGRKKAVVNLKKDQKIDIFDEKGK